MRSAGRRATRGSPCTVRNVPGSAWHSGALPWRREQDGPQALQSEGAAQITGAPEPLDARPLVVRLELVDLGADDERLHVVVRQEVEQLRVLLLRLALQILPRRARQHGAGA
eukprot:3176704-Prymnesium_polylepis.1